MAYTRKTEILERDDPRVTIDDFDNNAEESFNREEAALDAAADAVAKTVTAESEAAMLALTILPGRKVKRTDNKGLYELQTAPATDLANWTYLGKYDSASIVGDLIDDEAETSATKVRSVDGVKADIAAAIDALLGGAPGALDTLNELAAALGDDENFAATVTAALAEKVNSGSVLNHLGATDPGFVLDARQGKALKDLIDALTTGKVSKTGDETIAGNKTFSNTTLHNDEVYLLAGKLLRFYNADNSDYNTIGHYAGGLTTGGKFKAGAATETNEMPTLGQVNTAITAAIDALLAGAPGALDTLNELAAALGDDENFAATVTTALATKLTNSLSSETSVSDANITVTKGVSMNFINSEGENIPPEYGDYSLVTFGALSNFAFQLAFLLGPDERIYFRAKNISWAEWERIDGGDKLGITDTATDSAKLGGKTLSTVESERNTAITAAIDALLGGAPGALDTLNELAAALGDDENFAATVTAALAEKVNSGSVLNHLGATDPGFVLDARQGKALKDLIDALTTGKVSKTGDETIAGNKTFSNTTLHNDEVYLLAGKLLRFYNADNSDYNTIGHYAGGLTTGGKFKAAAATETNEMPTLGQVNTAITAAIDALLAGAPGALDTLNELAAALGDDEDFAATVTSALASKIPIASIVNTVDSEETDVPLSAYMGTYLKNLIDGLSASKLDTSATAADSTKLGGKTLSTVETERNTAITAAIDALLAGAPGALNTLNELADALGDDANFAATVTSALALKVPISAIVDNLTTNTTNVPLSAAQGKVLKDLYDAINAALTTTNSNVSSLDAALSPYIGSTDIASGVTTDLHEIGGDLEYGKFFLDQDVGSMTNKPADVDSGAGEGLLRYERIGADTEYYRFELTVLSTMAIYVTVYDGSDWTAWKKISN